MKIAANKVDGFLKHPSPDTKAFLVYGPDTGLVQERIATLLHTVLPPTPDPFALAELSADRLRSDPARLSDELAALTFTGSRKVVLLRDAGDELATLCGELFDQWPGDGLLLVSAGNLAGRSKLRRVFESAAAAAALPCYADEGDSLRRLVESVLAEHRVRADREALSYLTDHLGSDRAVTRAELEKVALYAGPGSEIDVDDAIACIGDSAAHTQDDLVLAVASGDYGGLELNLARLWQENTAAVTIIRSVQRHAHRLLRASAALDSGISAEAAMKKLQPPVFWKHQSTFLAQLRLWSVPRLIAALDLLTAAELQVKTTGMPERAACSRALLATAQLARRRDAT